MHVNNWPSWFETAANALMHSQPGKVLASVGDVQGTPCKHTVIVEILQAVGVAQPHRRGGANQSLDGGQGSDDSSGRSEAGK